MESGGERFHGILGRGKQKTSIAGWNTTKKLARAQSGGTAMMAFGGLLYHVTARAQDPDRCVDSSGLGSFCLMMIPGGPTKVRFVTYYRPGDPNRNTHRRAEMKEGTRPKVSVFEQHARYHMKTNVRTDSRALANKRLLTKLREWRADGKEILLMGNFNQDACNSPLARHLISAYIGLEEQFQKLHRSKAPFSHMLGKKAIMVIYATKGITIRSYFISKHNLMGSVGDHRLHVLDVCLKSIMGHDTPQMMKSARRRLQF